MSTENPPGHANQQIALVVRVVAYSLRLQFGVEECFSSFKLQSFLACELPCVANRGCDVLRQLMLRLPLGEFPELAEGVHTIVVIEARQIQ